MLINIVKWLLLGVAIVAQAALIITLDGANHRLDMKTRTIRDTGIEIQKSINQQKDFQLQIQQQIDELKAKVEAKKAEEAKIASQSTPSFPPAPVAEASGDAKMFIYAKESGNNPGAVNRSSGACGLGQALPCSKMPCSLSDYACQDNFFTGYMQSRYGTWENAKAFWISHRWW